MRIKLLSSLEKCFLDEDITLKKEYKNGSCLKNESYRFTVCYDIENIGSKQPAFLKIVSPIKDYIKVYKVEHVPVHMAAYNNYKDDNYLRTAPGIYPDLLVELKEEMPRVFPSFNLQSLSVEIETCGKVAAGSYPIEVQFINVDNNALMGSDVFTLEVIDAELPEQQLINTQWFYCDCLQDYYKTGNFDEEHWQIIENFASKAAKRGMNMILTPVFTPPLDTAVGGERTTTQLVDIKKTGDSYEFDFSKLGRWVDMCDRIGIKYLEISHFFTQWGAEHAPKIMAEVEGEQKRIFGWETDAVGEEYKAFLGVFIPEMLAFLKSKNNADKRCWFHISDEPQLEQLEQYMASRAVVDNLLSGYPIIDALSHYDFYEKGVVARPIPDTNHIEPFVEHNVPELWTYYCCGQAVDVSNRFISMPSARTRVIGIQMYKYNIHGFLHWGYNYYNDQCSYRQINPFVCTDGDYFAPAGDAFSVYPAHDGTACDSLRLPVFFDGLQDMRALSLCEKLYSREFVISLIDEGIEPVTFKNYPHDAEWLLNLRERVNEAIKKAI